MNNFTLYFWNATDESNKMDKSNIIKPIIKTPELNFDDKELMFESIKSIKSEQSENFTDILQKLESVETKKCATQNKLKHEELEELTKLLDDLNSLKAINQDLEEIIGVQKNQIQIIEQDMIKTNEVIEASNMELLEVDEQKIEYTGTKLTMSTIGATVVGTITIIIAGAKIGAIVGISALVLGTGWSVWPTKINP